jgi:flagellar FliL protein
LKLSVTNVILIISVFVLVGIGSAYFIFWLLTDHFGTSEVNDMVPVVKPMGPTFDVGEITVNLATNGNKSSNFVRVSIVLEVSDRKCLNQLDERLPQIRDLIITAFRKSTVQELIEDSSSQYVKQEIINAINPLLTKGEVTSVFITSLVVQ